jgi:hypothetical protein
MSASCNPPSQPVQQRTRPVFFVSTHARGGGSRALRLHGTMCTNAAFWLLSPRGGMLRALAVVALAATAATADHDDCGEDNMPAGFWCPNGEDAEDSLCPPGTWRSSSDDRFECTRCPQATPYSLAGATAAAQCVACVSAADGTPTGACDAGVYGVLVCGTTDWVPFDVWDGPTASHSCVLKVTTSLLWGPAYRRCVSSWEGALLLTTEAVSSVLIVPPDALHQPPMCSTARALPAPLTAAIPPCPVPDAHGTGLISPRGLACCVAVVGAWGRWAARLGLPFFGALRTTACRTTGTPASPRPQLRGHRMLPPPPRSRLFRAGSLCLPHSLRLRRGASSLPTGTREGVGEGTMGGSVGLSARAQWAGRISIARLAAPLPRPIPCAVWPGGAAVWPVVLLGGAGGQSGRVLGWGQAPGGVVPPGVLLGGQLQCRQPELQPDRLRAVGGR